MQTQIRLLLRSSLIWVYTVCSDIYSKYVTHNDFLIFQEEAKHAQEVVNLCQGILHLEALRTRTPEALSSDNGFLALINK